jgi:repressor LexA
MEISELLRALQVARGWTQEDLADQLDAGQSSVSRWLNGGVPGGRTLERIHELARESGIVVREPIPTNQAPLVGRVGAGALIEVEYEQPDGYDSVELPFSYPDPIVAFEVAGDSQLPVYEPGAVIVCLRDQVRSTDHYLGMPVVVRISSGERYLKRLARGSGKGRYNLESWNARTIEDVRVEWVGEILATVNRTAIRRIERREPVVVRTTKKRGEAPA